MVIGSRQAGDTTEQGTGVPQIEVTPEIVAHGERGVWVPQGMTAEEIMIGAAVLEQRFGVEHYEARSMVRSVLAALRNP